VLGDKVKISVIDSGVGIPPAKLIKLFERFERGEDTYSKSQEGTGIGLNLTRRLVDLNGGRIWVESEEGVGSTFSIMMPLAPTGIAVVTQPEMTNTITRLDGLSVFVVDDNADTCEVLKHVLVAAGATVHLAGNVKEGVTTFENITPDIILTDLAMPGESGLALIKHVRGLTTDKSKVPIIVLSACAFQSDKEAALGAGASMFLPKPFRPSEVLRNVRNLTLSAAMRRERA
jgi:CheY-like chemotaxis protein